VFSLILGRDIKVLMEERIVQMKIRQAKLFYQKLDNKTNQIVTNIHGFSTNRGFCFTIFKVTRIYHENSFILLVLIVLISCQNAIPKHETVNNIFKSDILKVIDEVSKLEGLIKSNSSTVELQKQFLRRTAVTNKWND
jgi:hypothetical protein